MAQINISDETRDRINKLITNYKTNKQYQHLKITQDYIIARAISSIEGEL